MTETRKKKPARETIAVNLTILDHTKLGGFHQGMCSADFANGDKVEVTSGFGCGNTHIYVAYNGKRVLAVDATPMLNALIDAAVDSQRKRGGK